LIISHAIIAYGNIKEEIISKVLDYLLGSALNIFLYEFTYHSSGVEI